MTKIINLTPHAIVVENEPTRRVYEPSGLIARVELFPVDGYKLGEIPVTIYTAGESNLPEPEEGTYYLVSAMVLEAMRDKRNDLIAPDTNQAKRNDKGHIISVPGFVC